MVQRRREASGGGQASGVTSWFALCTETLARCLDAPCSGGWHPSSVTFSRKTSYYNSLSSFRQQKNTVANANANATVFFVGSWFFNRPGAMNPSQQSC